MDAQVLQVTREDLQKYTEEVVVKLNGEFEKNLDSKLKSIDDKFESFRKDLLPKEKQDPDYIMGKTVFDMIKNPAKFKTLDPQDEASSADGGYLVPDVTRAEILRLIEEYGQARQYMRTLPMGKAKVVKIPKKLTGVTVSRIGENVSIPDSKVTLGQITLTASKAGLIVAMSSELDEDSIVDFGAYLNELIGEAFAQEEDEQFFAGTSSPHTGVFNTSSTYGNYVNVSSVDNIDYDSLVSCVRGIKQSYLRGGAWYMHRTVFGVIEKIKGTDGHPVVVNAGDPVRQNLFGLPVRLIESAPTSSTTAAGMPLVLLGNLNNSIVGLKRALTLKVLTEATIDGVNLAENDLVGLRVTKRDAFDAGLTQGYSVIRINP